MTCENLNRLSPWLDGELPPEEERGFSLHLASCSQCREAREEFLELRADLRSLAPRVDPFVQRRALTHILADSERSWWWTRRVRVPVPVLAAILIGFGVALGLALRDTPGAIPRAPVTEGVAAQSSSNDPDLSRYDRGDRAVLVVVPRESSDATPVVR